MNERGYIVRRGNRTVYPTSDRTVVVRVTTESGVIGWGETYGIVAPQAAMAIINDLLGPFVVGRDPRDVGVIHEDLYDLMRVRGYTGGFYLDALAAIDIALWDICGRLAGLPLVKLLGGQRHARLPAYVSGLPQAHPRRARRLRGERGRPRGSTASSSPPRSPMTASSAEMQTPARAPRAEGADRLRPALGTDRRAGDRRSSARWSRTASGSPRRR